ncbi:MAG: undecaprenyl/decaprenyl-phosphate alpha-N-acetylglucosaminyl 1-phosphate transferase, partial [Candidatus Omnitrophica bacterium]|nr:undecaprenyl/decaprenyl-phosphate alpha-N-acetylglucosaminyl 1-phosphate transferase [Candidatus Omnitrophota bacterium]
WRLTGKPALRAARAASSVAHLGSLGLVLACLIGLAGSSGALQGADTAWRGWLAGSAIVLGLGLVDDLWRELAPWVKGAGQVVAAMMLFGGGVRVEIVYWPAWFNGVVTLVWVVGLTNAFNLLDILDGLAATIAAVAALAFMILAVSSGQPHLAASAAVLTGALAGFLIVNWPPARLYLGDAGSQWVGFTLAALSLAIHYAPVGRETALGTPVVVLGLPVLDLAFVVWMRLRRGRSPFQKSRDHLALRWRAYGATDQQVVVRMAGFAAGFALVGLCVARGYAMAAYVVAAAVILAVALRGYELSAVNIDA